MAIAHVFQHHIKNIFVLGLITLLVACGGGGSSSKDTKPDAFSFTAVTGAAVSAEATSNTVTVAGTNKEAAISISNGTYSIDGGAFVGTAGTISSGQTVKVKVTSSATTNTPKVATLTIGGVTGTFTVTTAPDTTPDSFSFTTATGAAFASVNTSNTVTVGGFDIPVAISISSGSEYKIGTGAFMSTPSTISSGQTVTVRTTAATTVSTNVIATLTIGGVAGTYTVTTFADTVAPTAQIMFPPALSLSNGTTVKVRGTASDANSTITSVTVNGVVATSADNFAMWTADVPLTIGANTLTVVTTDSAANTNSDAAHVGVTRVASLTGAHFPDANVPFSYPSFFAIDSANNRALIPDVGLASIVSMSLTDGSRTLFSGASTPNTNNPLSGPQGIALDIAHNRALVVDYDLDAVVSVDLTSGARTILSDATTPTTSNALSDPYGIVLNVDTSNNRNRALVADLDLKAIIAVDLASGSRTILSDATTPNTNIPFSFPYSITLDNTHGRALVVDFGLNAIIAVDLGTGARTIVSDATTPNAINSFVNPKSLVLDNANNRMLVTDYDLSAVIAVNFTTGARTIVSNPTTPNANNIVINPVDISLDTAHNIGLIVSNDPIAIFAVDLTTGERVVVSK